MTPAQRSRRARAPSGRAADAAADAARSRVLVAEDNPINQQVAVQHAASSWATRVEVGGERPRGGRGAARASRYDVVLMDCQMPEMDGYEATARDPPARGRGAGARRSSP